MLNIKDFQGYEGRILIAADHRKGKSKTIHIIIRIDFPVFYRVSIKPENLNCDFDFLENAIEYFNNN